MYSLADGDGSEREYTCKVLRQHEQGRARAADVDLLLVVVVSFHPPARESMQMDFTPEITPARDFQDNISYKILLDHRVPCASHWLAVEGERAGAASHQV